MVSGYYNKSISGGLIMNTYYVALYDKDNLINQVTKVQKEMNSVDFKAYCFAKIEDQIFEVFSDHDYGYEVIEYLYKFKWQVSLKDVVDKLEDLQNEVYEINKEINTYLTEQAQEI